MFAMLLLPWRAASLGGICGSVGDIQEGFRHTCAQARKLHVDIDIVDDAATEVVLKKDCADIGKITYTLRLNGDRISEEHLGEYTQVMRESISRSLGGDVPDDAWSQATCGLKCGGLGLRTAEEVALPARPHCSSIG